MFNVNDVLKVIKENSDYGPKGYELKVIAQSENELLVQDPDNFRFKIPKTDFGVEFVVTDAYIPTAYEKEAYFLDIEGSDE
jgi:hypothetical protein